MRALLTILICVFVFAGCQKQETKESQNSGLAKDELMPVPGPSQNSNSFTPMKIKPAKDE